VLPITATSIRLFLHVLAATVWVGGQLTLAGLVPGLRAISTEAPRIAARSFNRIAWPAFAVLVATGIWNIADVNPTWDSEYGRTLILKGSDCPGLPRSRTPTRARAHCSLCSAR